MSQAQQSLNMKTACWKKKWIGEQIKSLFWPNSTIFGWCPWLHAGLGMDSTSIWLKMPDIEHKSSSLQGKCFNHWVTSSVLKCLHIRYIQYLSPWSWIKIENKLWITVTKMFYKTRLSMEVLLSTQKKKRKTLEFRGEI